AGEIPCRGLRVNRAAERRRSLITTAANQSYKSESQTTEGSHSLACSANQGCNQLAASPETKCSYGESRSQHQVANTEIIPAHKCTSWRTTTRYANHSSCRDYLPSKSNSLA